MPLRRVPRSYLARVCTIFLYRALSRAPYRTYVNPRLCISIQRPRPRQPPNEPNQRDNQRDNFNSSLSISIPTFFRRDCVSLSDSIRFVSRATRGHPSPTTPRCRGFALLPNATREETLREEREREREREIAYTETRINFQPLPARQHRVSRETSRDPRGRARPGKCRLYLATFVRKKFRRLYASRCRDTIVAAAFRRGKTLAAALRKLAS